MNKSYKSVWNESTGTWVAASELTTGRSKSKRAKNAISKAILTQIAVGGMSLAGAGIAMADDTVKSGTNATVNIADGVAIGVDSEVDADTAHPTKIGGIAIGDSAYAIGSGVAVGSNASASTDSLAFGAGATAANGGTAIGQNSYTINNGGLALGQNASVTGAGSLALGLNSKATVSGAVALGQDSVADRDNSVSVGSQGAERQITNVAAGTQGTDAVNLNQLNSATSGIARKAYSGIAAATALTMIPDVDANKTLSIGIGGGTFQGYAATAIGGTARITQNIKVRVGAGWSAAGTTVGAGASYQW